MPSWESRNLKQNGHCDQKKLEKALQDNDDTDSYYSRNASSDSDPDDGGISGMHGDNNNCYQKTCHLSHSKDTCKDSKDSHDNRLCKHCKVGKSASNSGDLNNIARILLRIDEQTIATI